MHFKAIRTPLYPKNRVDPLFPCEGFAFNNHAICYYCKIYVSYSLTRMSFIVKR